MRYVIACDSFKGSLSSQEVNRLIQKTIETFAKQKSEIHTYQLSDGGEGFLDTVKQYYPGGKVHSINVRNPLGRVVNAQYYCIDQIAYIESAEAIGIEKVYPDLAIEKATSFGLGELIVDAYRKGVRSFVVGLGGSATSDMGLGVLQAFGCVLKDENGEVLSEQQNNQFHVSKIIQSALFEKIKRCSFTVISDVEGTLLGPYGAAMMFSKQKGATREQQVKLESCARKIVELYGELGGEEKLDVSATAAAGGLGYFFQSLFHAKNEMGSQWFLRASGIVDVMIKDAILITGEGSVDQQTLQGKGPGAIAERAKKCGMFVIGIGGKVIQVDTEQTDVFDALFSIQSEPRPLVEAIKKEITEQQIIFTVRQLIALLERNSTNTL